MSSFAYLSVLLPLFLSQVLEKLEILSVDLNKVRQIRLSAK